MARIEKIFTNKYNVYTDMYSTNWICYDVKSTYDVNNVMVEMLEQKVKVPACWTYQQTADAIRMAITDTVMSRDMTVIEKDGCNITTVWHDNFVELSVRTKMLAA